MTMMIEKYLVQCTINWVGSRVPRLPKLLVIPSWSSASPVLLLCDDNNTTSRLIYSSPKTSYNHPFFFHNGGEYFHTWLTVNYFSPSSFFMNFSTASFSFDRLIFLWLSKKLNYIQTLVTTHDSMYFVLVWKERTDDKLANPSWGVDFHRVIISIMTERKKWPQSAPCVFIKTATGAEERTPRWTHLASVYKG